MKTRMQKKLENILLPLALNVNPNLVTLLSVILMLFSAFFLLKEKLIISSIFLAFSALLDALDGLIAKKYKRESDFGAFLDRTADRINDSIIIIAIILGGYIHIEVGLLVLFLILLASYMSATIELISKTRIGEAISMRPLRMFLIFFGLLFNQLYYLMWALLLIGFFAVCYRFYKAVYFLK